MGVEKWGGDCGMFFFFFGGVLFGVYKGVWFGEEKVFGLRKFPRNSDTG